MIRAVFFDLDGTLVNSLRDIAAAMNGALAAFGLPGFSPEEYRHKVGNGARRSGFQRQTPCGRNTAAGIWRPAAWRPAPMRASFPCWTP